MRTVVDVKPGQLGGRCGLQVVELAPGRPWPLSTGDAEMLVLPLSGSLSVGSFALRGRRDVFAGPSDFVYLPPHTHTALVAPDAARVALPYAASAAELPARYRPAADVPVELRGAGACARTVSNICMPGTFEAGSLLVCEVHTPAGHWSSYPPHKHDETVVVDGVVVETALAELYYFEIPGGLGYQRVYASDDRPIDVLAEVRTGDVVLVPYGWHGPSIAAPGYDMYYLNVMAGPRRAWVCRDDPAHAWVRSTW